LGTELLKKQTPLKQVSKMKTEEKKLPKKEES